MHKLEEKMEFGGSKKTISSYLVGFGLSLILTVLAFGLCEFKLLSEGSLYKTLAVLAILQLLVQSLCFLRLNTSKEGRSNLFPFLFTLLIIAILVGGSLWIMYNLNYNMMS